MWREEGSPLPRTVRRGMGRTEEREGIGTDLLGREGRGCEWGQGG
jgi:hypothetical protein